MIAQMTLAEIQAKYAGVHTPSEVAQYQQNMTSSDKWKVKKNEWTWEGLTHVQLRGRALQYDPNLNMVQLYQEHPYKTALRLVPSEKYLDDSGDEESVIGSDLELDDEAEDEHDVKVKDAIRCTCRGQQHSFANEKCKLYMSQAGERIWPGKNKDVSEEDWHFCERMRKRRKI